ncbi:MAG: polysaccharide deacetylase family protein [Nannocystis sp.]|nr:polysaccharide deacetylase family protein [Nannocystis sp.]
MTTTNATKTTKTTKTTKREMKAGESKATLLSVDLDDVGCYHALHGLAAPTPAQQRIVLERCLPRLLEVLEGANSTATFFVVGRDLERDLAAGGRGAGLLRQALAAGNELANHSFEHRYDLSEQAGPEIFADLRRCDRLLRGLGAAPLGFRAPGYTHNRRLLEQVAALGYRYDSSRLPSPPYFLAKLGALAWLRARGRRSQASARGLGSFVGADRPSFRADVGLWEVPISVLPFSRLPMVGTLVLSSDAATRSAARLGFLHLELHAIDLADPENDGFDAALIRRQPELRGGLERRRARLRWLLKERGGSATIAGAFGS